MSYSPNKIRLQELAHKWLDGTLNKTEQAEFDQWFSTVNNDPVEVYALIDSTEQEYEKELFKKIRDQIETGAERKVIKLWPSIAAAASILLFLSIGTYFYLRPKPQQQVAQHIINDVKPGTNQATLTLANGQKIILTKSLNGKLAQQGNTAIHIQSGSSLTYIAGASVAKVEYNTLTTKRGEQSPFPLVLADGSHVWLNAASSITFPTAFDGNSREVKITGEAYFEVAHNPHKPFRVTVNGETVEVLGTHFNINAYTDEPVMKTTLLEGSIKLTKNGQQALLKPGQQGIVAASSNAITVNTANTKLAMAWHDGKFSFDQTELKTVMRQVARWYDIDIVYQGNVQDDAFDGEFSREENLSQMLKILKSGDVHFELVQSGDKKKLIITP